MYNTLEFSALDSTLTSDYQRAAPGQNASSSAEMMELMQQIRQAYPDLHLTAHERSFDENLAFVHWTVTATGPDGKIAVQGISIFKYRDGKIARDITYSVPPAVPA